MHNLFKNNETFKYLFITAIQNIACETIMSYEKRQLPLAIITPFQNRSLCKIIKSEAF